MKMVSRVPFKWFQLGGRYTEADLTWTRLRGIEAAIAHRMENIKGTMQDMLEEAEALFDVHQDGAGLNRRAEIVMLNALISEESSEGLGTLKQFEREMSRIKQAFEPNVSALRVEIEALWERCHVPAKVREQYRIPSYGWTAADIRASHSQIEVMRASLQAGAAESGPPAAAAAAEGGGGGDGGGGKSGNRRQLTQMRAEFMAANAEILKRESDLTVKLEAASAAKAESDATIEKLTAEIKGHKKQMNEMKIDVRKADRREKVALMRAEQAEALLREATEAAAAAAAAAGPESPLPAIQSRSSRSLSSSPVARVGHPVPPPLGNLLTFVEEDEGGAGAQVDVVGGDGGEKEKDAMQLADELSIDVDAAGAADDDEDLMDALMPSESSFADVRALETKGIDILRKDEAELRAKCTALAEELGIAVGVSSTAGSSAPMGLVVGSVDLLRRRLAELTKHSELRRLVAAHDQCAVMWFELNADDGRVQPTIHTAI